MTKFDDETPTDIVGTPTEDVPMIVFRQPYLDENGAMNEKIHGPMPVADWTAYEKEHGL